MVVLQFEHSNGVIPCSPPDGPIQRPPRRSPARSNRSGRPESTPVRPDDRREQTKGWLAGYESTNTSGRGEFDSIDPWRLASGCCARACLWHVQPSDAECRAERDEGGSVAHAPAANAGTTDIGRHYGRECLILRTVGRSLRDFGLAKHCDRLREQQK